ncbi:MAG: PEP-CTERM sorting domain-containing protein [Candidatus Omnitrophota bacterium]
MNKYFIKITCKFAILATALILSSSAYASPILEVSSITSDTPVFASYYSLENGINQSGLSSGYTSGVTDFDEYFLTNPYHDNYAATSVGLERYATSASLFLDLGSVSTIESFALWNRYYSNQGVSSFSLYASSDSSYTDEFLIGSFIAQTGLGAENQVLAEIFEFAPIETQFVRFNVTGTYGAYGISFKELAFEQSACVPEPSTFMLLVVGMLVIFMKNQCSIVGSNLDIRKN